MLRTILTTLSALLAMPLTVLAHAGHGVGEGTEMGHYLLSTEHIIPIAIAVAITVAILAFRRAAREEKNRS